MCTTDAAMSGSSRRLQVAYYLQEQCGKAVSSFLRSDVTGAFSELPLDCSTLDGANDRAAGAVLLHPA